MNELAEGSAALTRVAAALLDAGLLARVDLDGVLAVIADVAREQTRAQAARVVPGALPEAGDGPGPTRLTAILRGPDGEAMATLVLDPPTEGAFEAPAVEVAEALAHYGAAAVHRARTFAEAEAAASRERGHASAMRALAETAVRLNAPLPIDAMLADVTETARRIVGARWAVSTLSGDVAMRVVAAADGDGGPPAGAPHLAAPLRGPDGADLGALELFDKRSADLDETDQAIVVQLAQLAASAIGKERLLEAQARLAATLQRSLLPERLPDVAGVEMAARYASGVAEVDVGGDWYDALTLPDGDLFLVVGDVVGKGVEAAAAMGQLRHCLRTYAFEGLEPAAALERLNVLVNTLGGSEFATVVAARLTPPTGQLRYASAGHPPPLVVTPGAGAEFLDGAQSVPLGALPRPAWGEGRRVLSPGSTLVLYTDGLVESRSLSLDVGLERLAAAAQGCGDPAILVDHLLELATSGHQADDSAVLAIRLTACAEQFRIRLPAEFASVAAVRRRLRTFLGACGIDGQTTDEVTLACSEAAANAVEHPVAPRHHSIEVEASVEGEGIRVVVRDFGQWRSPPPVSERGRGLALMRMLMDVEVASRASGTEVLLRRPRA